MSRQCQCGGVVSQYDLTNDREAWRCGACGRYAIFEKRPASHAQPSGTVNPSSGSGVMVESTCGGAETDAEPSRLRSQPLSGQGCRRIGSAALRAFALQSQGGYWRSRWPNVVGAPGKAMALCEPRRPRPCSRDRNKQATQNHAGLAHHTGAWKLNADAQRAVALPLAEGGRKAHGMPRGSLFTRTKAGATK